MAALDTGLRRYDEATARYSAIRLILSTSFALCRQTSIYPRQYLLQGRKEPLPPALGALVGLLLIRPEA
jgi:hypothetical protein